LVTAHFYDLLGSLRVGLQHRIEISPDKWFVAFLPGFFKYNIRTPHIQVKYTRKLSTRPENDSKLSPFGGVAVFLDRTGKIRKGDAWA
jgi:hypothetical protein